MGVPVLTIIPNNLISDYLYPVTEILNFAGLEVSVSRGNILTIECSNGFIVLENQIDT